MINSLKGLSGSTRVVQDDFNKGVGVFRIICKTPPAVKIADVKTKLGKYKLDKVEFKVTGKLSKKRGDKLSSESAVPTIVYAESFVGELEEGMFCCSCVVNCH